MVGGRVGLNSGLAELCSFFSVLSFVSRFDFRSDWAVEDERMTAANRSNGFDEERTYGEGRDEKDEHPLGCPGPQSRSPCFLPMRAASRGSSSGCGSGGNPGR